MAPVVNILSLDGGGIRGISSLLILQRIMETIQKQQNLEEVPRPCEYFNLIGGTSTGGIIAIMLGRLGMTVEGCIEAYRCLAERAFTPKHRLIRLPISPKGVYSAEALEMAVKEAVKDQCKKKNCLNRRTCTHGDEPFYDDSCVKTVVLAITKENVDAKPTLFKTYDKTGGFHDCKIWEVARATSAASTFFESIKLGRDQIEFIDAGFGYNNPCEVLMDEAQNQFPETHQWRVLSIGTGLGAVVTIKNTRVSILKALKSIATESKKVADNMDRKHGKKGQYYRFNVDRGLEDITLADWHKDSQISAHTHNYLQDRGDDIKQCALAFSTANDELDDIDNQGEHAPTRQKSSEKDRNDPKATSSRLAILRNTASQNAKQHNSISGVGAGGWAQISDNGSSGGSKQWNLISS